MKNSLTCQSSAGFAGNTVFTTQCLQKAKLLPTSGCVDRSFIIIIIIALLGVIIDHHHHHHHHHYTPPSILFGQTLRSSRALVLFSGAARWRRLFNRPRWSRWRWKSGGVEDVQVELQGWVEGAKAAMVSKFKNFLLHRGW